MYSNELRVEQEWFVVFHTTVGDRWYHRWLKREFHHCYCITKSEAGLFWIAVLPHWSHTEIDYRLADTFPKVTDYTGDNVLILSYTTDIDPMKHCAQLGILTCVDVVKRHLGIRAHLVFTPYQLYKNLINRGAVSL